MHQHKAIQLTHYNSIWIIGPNFDTFPTPDTLKIHLMCCNVEICVLTVIHEGVYPNVTQFTGMHISHHGGNFVVCTAA